MTNEEAIAKLESLYCLQGALEKAISAIESIAERDLVLVELEHFKKAFKDQVEGKRGVYHCDVCKYGGETYAECLKHECPKDCDGFNHWEWGRVTDD